MCGSGCVKIVKKVTLAIPASGDKKESRLFGAYRIEKSGQKTLIAPNGCAAAIDLEQFLKKTGAVIINPR